MVFFFLKNTFFNNIKYIYINNINNNFKKKFFLINENYKFYKKIINFLFIIKKKIINIKFYKKNIKRFHTNIKNNFENSKIFIKKYYYFLNFYLIKKKSKFIIIKKMHSFNKIILYNMFLFVNSC